MNFEEYVKDEFREMKKRHDKQDEKFTTMDSRLDCIEKKLTRYKGFLGGVTFVLSCLGAFFAMALKVFKGGHM